MNAAAQPLFTQNDVIHAYTRAQSIEDGFLADVSETAREAGIRFPVAITQEAWADCVAWDDEAEARKGGTGQSEAGRLWDVLWMLRMAISRIQGNVAMYEIYRVPREGRGVKPRRVTLKAVCGPGDQGEPVITIMLPYED